jgi:D-threonate/D-erythronate kinase
MPLPRLAILADDLTGALDAAAPFLRDGKRVLIATSPAHIARALAAEPDVIAVNCSSREGSEAQAVAATIAALTELKSVPRLFKKIDSRLKGHVIAELACLLAHRSYSEVILCPAIPEMGRIQQGGQLFGQGIPTPIRLPSEIQGGQRLCIPDASTEAEIDQILQTVTTTSLLVGARGLSAGLARQLSPGKPTPFPLPLPQPLALAIGSRDPITLAQVAALLAAHETATICAPDGISHQLPPTAPLALFQTTKGSTGATSAEVTAAFATCFAALWVTGRKSLLLSGGESASAILAEMGVTVLELLGEALPGLPVSRPLDSADAPLIITKSGGFGGADTLCRLLLPSPERPIE